MLKRMAIVQQTKRLNFFSSGFLGFPAAVFGGYISLSIAVKNSVTARFGGFGVHRHGKTG